MRNTVITIHHRRSEHGPHFTGRTKEKRGRSAERRADPSKQGHIQIHIKLASRDACRSTFSYRLGRLFCLPFSSSSRSRLSSAVKCCEKVNAFAPIIVISSVLLCVYMQIRRSSSGAGKRTDETKALALFLGLPLPPSSVIVNQRQGRLGGTVLRSSDATVEFIVVHCRCSIVRRRKLATRQGYRQRTFSVCK